jgi:uncharacterized protein YukJ
VLRNYGALRGRPVAARTERVDDQPHYQIHVVARGGRSYRVAVNVQGADRSALLFFANEDFQHPLTSRLESLASGYSTLQRAAGGVALDFVRSDVVQRSAMRTVAADVLGPDNDLNEYIDRYVQLAIHAAHAEIFALGEPWGPEPRKADPVFRFMPGGGMHNVHMNQGNVARHRGEDGVWQDGALFIHLPEQPRWIAIFLAFQSQAWLTDVRGHALGRAPRTMTDLC